MSPTDEYRQLLLEAYDGERLGVVLGRELAARTTDERERAVHVAFERVEAVARAQLDPMVVVAGVGGDAQPEADVERQGADLARQMTERPRAEAWADMLPEFERFIGHLQRLRELSPGGDRRPYDLLVEHEVASVAMVRALIDGDLDGAERVLQEFLATV